MVTGSEEHDGGDVGEQRRGERSHEQEQDEHRGRPSRARASPPRSRGTRKTPVGRRTPTMTIIAEEEAEHVPGDPGVPGEEGLVRAHHTGDEDDDGAAERCGDPVHALGREQHVDPDEDREWRTRPSARHGPVSPGGGRRPGAATVTTPTQAAVSRPRRASGLRRSHMARAISTSRVVGLDHQGPGRAGDGSSSPTVLVSPPRRTGRHGPRPRCGRAPGRPCR